MQAALVFHSLSFASNDIDNFLWYFKFLHFSNSIMDSEKALEDSTVTSDNNNQPVDMQSQETIGVSRN